MNPTILIVEDEKKVASFIKKGLEENAFNAEIAYDGVIGNKLALSNDYDAVVLDINIPQLNGLEVCKSIRNRKPHVPILMLTALGTTEDKLFGFEAGADDYLVKPFEFRELLARIRSLLRRATSKEIVGDILRIADLELHTKSMEVKRSGKKIELTPKEFTLLEFLMRNKGIVLSRAAIAERVWEITFDTGTNVIDVYVNFLRKKIDKDFPVKLIHTQMGIGYVLKEE